MKIYRYGVFVKCVWGFLFKKFDFQIKFLHYYIELFSRNIVRANWIDHVHQIQFFYGAWGERLIAPIFLPFLYVGGVIILTALAGVVAKCEKLFAY